MPPSNSSGTDSSVDGAEHSVLARLSVDGSYEPPLLLSEAAGEEGSPLVTPVSRSEGRYQVMGEIARGGVGVVLRGHDVDLGRAVAMKVLREDFAKDADILQRFVEEAQIGGQLQHPGIVPVYEMGLGEDKRPYFTMKLVKGETLASLLEDSEAGDGGRRLLEVFESVCQTMAYAHSRGVIHRDLKPANIMVGAFGEVLVVDWGMGKVLRADGAEHADQPVPTDRSMIATLRSGSVGSQSIVGSVMGTPRYMPPEQARGDIDAVDQRSDVFSLGAILCEILTGKPPYEGSGQEAFGLACRGDLTDALLRLENCEAHEDLVSLARDCLVQAPLGRPKDAARVAKRVSTHLASLDGQTRAARIEAAEARVRAASDRRRRRLHLVLAGSVAALLVLVVGGWTWMRTASYERERETSLLVSEALDEAVRLQGLALAADTPAAFDAAIVAVGRARAVLATGSVTEAAAARVGRVATALEEQRAAAAGRETVRLRDATMLARLEEIEVEQMQGGRRRDAEANYRGAFRGYGIDPETQSDAELRTALDASAIRLSLWTAFRKWAGLDQYLFVAGDAELAAPTLRRRWAKKGPSSLSKVLQRVEADPWWIAFNAGRSLEDYQAIAADPALFEKTRHEVLSLAIRLTMWRDEPTARRLARTWLERSPRDFAARVDLGSLWAMGVPMWSEALRHMRAAVALRPDEPAPRHRLASYLLQAGTPAEALAQARHAKRLGADPVFALSLEAEILIKLARNEEAEAVVRRLIAQAPDSGLAQLRAAYAFINIGEFELGRDAARRVVEIADDDATGWAQLGLALHYLGDLKGANEAADKALALDPHSLVALDGKARLLHARGEHAGARSLLERAVAVAPAAAPLRAHLARVLLSMGDLDAAAGHARRALAALSRPGAARSTHERYARSTAHATLGLVARRKSEPAEAIRHLRLAVEAYPGNAHAAADLALTLAINGKKEEARKVAAASVASAPGDPNVLAHLGNTLWRLGDNEPALAAFEKARAMGWWNPRQLHVYEMLLLWNGERERMLEVTAAQRAADPGIAGLTYPFQLMRVGRMAEALRTVDEDLARSPNNAVTRVVRSRILIEIGRFAEARADLDRAVALEKRVPNHNRTNFDQLVLETRASLSGAALYESFVAGEFKPAGGQMLSAMGIFALRSGDVAKALALMEESFAATPSLEDDPDSNFRAEAAYCAIQLKDYDKAYAWLKAEIDMILERCERDGEEFRRKARNYFSLMLMHDMVAPVRETEHLAKLPSGERARWEALWKRAGSVFPK